MISGALSFPNMRSAEVKFVWRLAQIESLSAADREPTFEMPHNPKNYFRYIPETPESTRWGVEVRGCGFAKIPAHSEYPPAGHPPDHRFDFKKGRVLQSLQILCIAEGNGVLKTSSCRRQRLSAGAVMLLLPGEWHTYRPDPTTGWAEHWIELGGAIPRQLLRDGVFQANRCVFPEGAASGIESVFQKIHPMLDGRRDASVPELSAQAFQLLTLCSELPTSSATRANVVEKVRRAERCLSNLPNDEPPDLPRLAKELGWGYSYFRRVFREQTGLSPWQYHLQARLSQACRLLASSDDTLQGIAETTGFASAFHLSNAFKKAYGESPGRWRTRSRLQ